MEIKDVKIVIYLVAFYFALVSQVSFAQLQASHATGTTCAHSNHGEGACISNHSGGSLYYQEDCKLRQSGTTWVHHTDNRGDQGSTSSITDSVEYYASAPPNKWCVVHHGRYEDRRGH
jgi:hypothetical protein